MNIPNLTKSLLSALTMVLMVVSLTLTGCNADSVSGPDLGASMEAADGTMADAGGTTGTQGTVSKGGHHNETGEPP